MHASETAGGDCHQWRACQSVQQREDAGQAFGHADTHAVDGTDAKGIYDILFNGL
jgi:hypothetical protein